MAVTREDIETRVIEARHSVEAMITGRITGPMGATVSGHAVHQVREGIEHKIDNVERMIPSFGTKDQPYDKLARELDDVAGWVQLWRFVYPRYVPVTHERVWRRGPWLWDFSLERTASHGDGALPRIVKEADRLADRSVSETVSVDMGGGGKLTIPAALTPASGGWIAPASPIIPDSYDITPTTRASTAETPRETHGKPGLSRHPAVMARLAEIVGVPCDIESLVDVDVEMSTGGPTIATVVVALDHSQLSEIIELMRPELAQSLIDDYELSHEPSVDVVDDDREAMTPLPASSTGGAIPTRYSYDHDLHFVPDPKDRPVVSRHDDYTARLGDDYAAELKKALDMPEDDG